MRKQKNITLIIGSETLPKEFNDYVIYWLSSLCGGCTVMESAGYWIDEAGKTKQTTYDADKLETEQTLHIELTTELDKYDFVMRRIKDIIANAKNIHNVDIEWVHCKVMEIEGHHFKV